MDNETTLYDFEATDIQGKTVSMKEYQGKTVLIVNTASKCGLTPQYTGLEVLYKKYREKGLVILGFPCNQFGNQEPGDERSISGACLVNYGVTFPMFSKIDVNGDNAHPLFVFLKNRLPGMFGQDIKWNFTKFIISRNGIPIKRYAPTKKPERIEMDIVSLLQEQGGSTHD